jgi:hypothetical protein
VDWMIWRKGWCELSLFHYNTSTLWSKLSMCVLCIGNISDISRQLTQATEVELPTEGPDEVSVFCGSASIQSLELVDGRC